MAEVLSIPLDQPQMDAVIDVTPAPADHPSSVLLLGPSSNPRDPAKPFECPDEQCASAFARRSDLVRHGRIHTNERRYVCTANGCGRGFLQQSALTVHKRTHTGERPHKCETCERAFADSSSLARHRKTHSSVKPFPCTFPGCDRSFARKTTLVAHVQKHDQSDPVTYEAACTAASIRRVNTNPRPSRLKKPNRSIDDDDSIHVLADSIPVENSPRGEDDDLEDEDEELDDGDVRVGRMARAEETNGGDEAPNFSDARVTEAAISVLASAALKNGPVIDPALANMGDPNLIPVQAADIDVSGYHDTNY